MNAGGWVGSLALLLPLVATAAPQVSQKAAPDARGVVAYWVKCDNGDVAVIDCFKDKLHCGEQYDQPIQRVALAACAAIGPLTLFKGK
jgi:hypothetical protein